ncbi:signal peptide peptidase SppA [Muribaculaceae bacterium Isolate-013 (NCI)]|nr:signal peptide peptidase SppA [Muribaculaceae bacterium Isolate-013 (NCI)]
MMLKNFFISMLGALTAFWISIMLLFILGVVFAAGTIVSAIGGAASVAVEKNSVLYLPLSGVIEERQTTVEFTSLINQEARPVALDDIIRSISAAADDDRIEGIYLDCQGASAGVATRLAIRKALEDFKKGGKWVVAYADSYTQGDYYVASVASEIYLNPIGAVDIHGLGSLIPFFKGLLDKLGVEMQVVKVGTYKSAVEPYIMTAMSEPAREQTLVFLTNIWNQITVDIKASRGVSVEALNQMADSLVALGNGSDYFVENKLVDGLAYQRQVTDKLKEKVGLKADDALRSVYFGDYLQVADVPHEKSNKNKIAVYYAFGNIVDHGSQGISAEQMVPDITDLAEDDDIKAMVLRVNSGGGSAFASEQIWEALQYFKSKGKKLYVSMGDYAASGGYYISCGADRIYAEPVTLTGSIGIFGMMPCAQQLAQNIGVSISTVTTNNGNAVFPNVFEPMTPTQRSAMQREVDNGYELFTRRCAEGRGISQDSIKVIGEGRVWDGLMARKLGLVDALGSLDQAVGDLAKDMKYTAYQVVSYPNPDKSFWDIISDFDRQMKVRAIREELGAAYPLYQEYKAVAGMERIQARIPYMIVE